MSDYRQAQENQEAQESEVLAVLECVAGLGGPHAARVVAELFGFTHQFEQQRKTP